VIEAAREPFMHATEASIAKHFSWLYASEPAREFLELFFALEHELHSTVRPGLDHNVAHARLGWWQTEAERTAAGKPVHPLTIAIARQRDAARLPCLDLRAFVATLAWDLAGIACPTDSQLQTYTSAWSRDWFASLAELLAPASLQARPVAIALGSSLRELQLLALTVRDPELAGLRIPGDALARVGLNAAALAVRPMRASLYDLLAARHAAARRVVANAAAQVPAEMQPAWTPLLVWAYCEHQESRATAIELPKNGVPSTFARIGRAFGAWRAALNSRAGKFALPSR
jgi:hypothetical protein